MSVAGIPHDVAALILSYLSTPERLNSASLVSRQWRAAALHATTSLSDPVDLQKASQLVTRLECLRLTGGMSRPLPVFPFLRSLCVRFSVGGIVSEHEHVTSLQRCMTTLSTLELIEPNFATLSMCSASVTSLQLQVQAPELDMLLQLAFPRLTALRILAVNARFDEYSMVLPKVPRLIGALLTRRFK